HKPAPRKAAMVVGRLESVNDEKLRLFHDNLGAHVMARQVADVGEHAGGLRPKPQLGPPVGRNQDADEPGLVELGCAVPAHLDVCVLQEQQGDKGVQVLIVVADDERDGLSLLQRHRLRAECPFAGVAIASWKIRLSCAVGTRCPKALRARLITGKTAATVLNSRAEPYSTGAHETKAKRRRNSASYFVLASGSSARWSHLFTRSTQALLPPS